MDGLIAVSARVSAIFTVFAGYSLYNANASGGGGSGGNSCFLCGGDTQVYYLFCPKCGYQWWACYACWQNQVSHREEWVCSARTDTSVNETCNVCYGNKYLCTKHGLYYSHGFCSVHDAIISATPYTTHETSCSHGYTSQHD